jgi:hypothetical protein
MRIDRRTFLVLTAALASDACEAQPPPAAPVAGVIDVPTVPDASHGDAPDASSPQAPDAAVAWSAADAAPPPESSVADDSCASANAQRGSADCSQLRAPPGPACESFEDTRSECEDIQRVLKPAVAERAVRCLLAKSGTRGICQFGVSAVCVSQAFRASCGDPATSAMCSEVVRSCAGRGGGSAVPKLTFSECEGALSAVSPQNRDAMLGCMSEGCTAGYCFSSLR